MAYKDIYDIPSQFNELEKMLLEEEIDEELYKQLVDDVIEICNKDLDSARAFLLHLKNKLDVIKYESDRLNSISKSTEKTIDAINNIFKIILSKNDGKKITTTNGYISSRKSKSVEILDESKIDNKYKDTKTVTTVSKTKIKEDIANGIEVSGATITEKISVTVK